MSSGRESRLLSQMRAEAEDATRQRIAERELLHPDAFGRKMAWTPRRLADAVLGSQVFFIEHQGEIYFPAFFADPRNDRRHMGAITKLLQPLPSGSKMQFFLNRRGSLAGRTPLEALRDGDWAKVRDAAQAFLAG